jgi:hypothetical protein
MRLLERKGDGEYSLTNDLISNIPPYTILSHTWGSDGEEVRDVSGRRFGQLIGGKAISCGDA